MPIYQNLEYIRTKRPVPAYVERDIYDIPVIQADNIDITDINNGKWLISLNNASGSDSLAAKKIVHSFKCDNVLRRWYNQPFKYLAYTASYYAVSSFDFSMDEEMEFPQIMAAVFSNRWSGIFAQTNGRKVVPTVGWTIPAYYDLCFSGLRDGGVFLISTLGTNNDESRHLFLEGYYELRNRFPNTRIICVGDRVPGIDTDVCMVRYEESFGSWNKKNKYWQPSFLNWDMSVANWR